MSEINIASDEQVRSILFDRQDLQLYPGGGRVGAAQRAIRAGDLLSINQSNDRFQVTKFTNFTATEAQGVTELAVADAHAFEVGDVCELDDGASLQEDLTIGSINYDTNVLTMTSGIADAAGFNALDVVRVVANEQDRVVGIALEALRDRDAAVLGFGANDLTPRLSTTMYGQICIGGRIKLAEMQDFTALKVLGSTRPDLDLAGARIASMDIYVFDKPLNAILEA